MSSTGTTTSRSSCFALPASTISIGRPPETKRAISSSGRCVAESPTRWIGSGVSLTSRSRLTARCAPRFVPAIACTSSTIRYLTLSRFARACEVRSRKSDSGVVIRISGGLRSIAWRSFWGVSPVRTADLQTEADAGERPAEVPLDVVVERLQRAHVEHLEATTRLCLVERPEERCERLARSGRRLDQRVCARRDRGPAARLGGRRGIERLLEPRPDRRAERRERIHPPSVAMPAAPGTRVKASASRPALVHVASTPGPRLDTISS